MNKKFSVVIALLLVFALAMPMTVSAATFTDVPESHWAYEAVNEMVAAGILSGYSDGTFKGKNTLTRFQIAIIISRVLDRVEEEREALANEVDSMKDGFTADQKVELKDIVKSIMEENNVTSGNDSEGLNEKEYEQIANLIEALTFNYKAELQNLGADVSDLEDLVDSNKEEIEARIAALESEEPVVSFSGSYSVDFEHQALTEGTASTDVTTDYYWFQDDAAKTTAENNIVAYLNANDDNEAADGIDDEVAAGNVYEETSESDPYVTVPWTNGDETVTTNQDKGFSQTLTFKSNINKDGFNAVLDIAATEDEDEMAIDSMGLTLENDFVKGVYNDVNTVELADFAYNEKEINGATVEFKDYGVDTFFGIKEKAAGEDTATVESDETFTDANGTEFTYTGEKTVTKYEWDSDENEFVAKSSTEDFYAYGAEKTLGLAGLELNTTFAGERDKNDKDVMTNVFGLSTIKEFGSMKANFDMAYSMVKNGDSGTFMDMGVSNDLGIADMEFNYRNVNDKFTYLDEKAALTDSDEDAYDLYTTAMNAGLSGWNFTVAPKIIDSLDASVFYGKVNDADNEDNTKMAIDGEMPFILDGLTVSGNYEQLNEAGDETKTTGFGAEYVLLNEKVTGTFDYTMANPVEDEALSSVTADKTEKTMKMGLDYNMNDYLSANFNRTQVTNLGYVDKALGEDINKTSTSFGADITEYPVFGNLTTSAGFSYTKVDGYEFTDADPDAVNPTESISVDSLEEKATEMSMGLGYKLGAADLSYDLTNTEKEGAGVDNGTYRTHDFGLVYPVVEGTDFTANYEIKNVEGDELDNWTVKTATAGVSVSF